MKSLLTAGWLFQKLPSFLEMPAVELLWKNLRLLSEPTVPGALLYHPACAEGSPAGFVPLSPWPSSNLSPAPAAGGGRSCDAGLVPAVLAGIVPTALCPCGRPWGPLGEGGPGLLATGPQKRRGRLWEHKRLQSKVLECSSCSERSGNSHAEQPRENPALHGGCLGCKSTSRKMRSPETTSPSMQHCSSSCITCTWAWVKVVGGQSSSPAMARAAAAPRQLRALGGAGRCRLHEHQPLGPEGCTHPLATPPVLGLANTGPRAAAELGGGLWPSYPQGQGTATARLLCQGKSCFLKFSM